MTKFIEIRINGQLHLININNIAMIKQINGDITEFHLLTKNEKEEQIKFQVVYNYMNFKKLIEGNNSFGLNFTLNEFK